MDAEKMKRAPGQHQQVLFALFLAMLTLSLAVQTAAQPSPKPAPSLIQAFENRIAEKILSDLVSGFAALPSQALDSGVLASSLARRKLNLLDYYQSQLASIDTSRLEKRNQLRLQLLAYTRLMLQQQVDYAATDNSLTPFHGPHIDLLKIINGFPLNSAADLAPMIQQLERLARGLKAASLPLPILHEGLDDDECLTTISRLHQMTDLEFLNTSFKARLRVTNLPVAAQAQHADALQETLKTRVLPAFDPLLKNVSCTAAERSAEAHHQAYYHYRLRRFTASEQSAKAFHALGLGQLRRLQDDTATFWQQYPSGSTSPAYLSEIRSSADFDLQDGEQTRQQYLSAVSAEINTITQALSGPLDFGDLPNLEISAAAGPLTLYSLPFSYRSDYAQSGQMLINFDHSGPPRRHELVAQTYMNAMPGMHLVSHHPATLSVLMSPHEHPAHYAGWSLFLANLALQSASGPDRLGQLTLNAELAAMLVVDTGIHAMNWSRQTALAFLQDNTSLSVGRATRLVDEVRYRPAAMISAYAGMLSINDWIGTETASLANSRAWQTRMALGPVPAPMRTGVFN